MKIKKESYNKGIQRLREHLGGNTRDLMLFELTYSTSSPLKELLSLRVSQVAKLKPAQKLPISSQYGSTSNTRLTHEAYAAIQKHLKAANQEPIKAIGEDILNQEDRITVGKTNPPNTDYLFASNKQGVALSVPNASRLMKKWWPIIDNINISGLTSLRKAYYQHHKRKSSTVIKAITGTPQTNSSTLAKISNTSIQSQVYQQLESAIISGKITPGQKLITEDLARIMNVSRIPVREAMGRLQAKGLIETKPRWGSIVTKLSPEQLAEILELRLILEAKAAEKACVNVTPEFITELKQSQSRFKEARKTADTDLLLACNRDFHFLIYQQSNSDVLFDLITQLWNKVSPYYHLLFRQSLDHSPNAGLRNHDMIIEHFEIKNTQAVIDWVKQDLKESSKFIYTLFD